MNLTWLDNLLKLFKAIIGTFKDLMLDSQMVPTKLFVHLKLDLITKYERPKETYHS